MTKYEDLKNLPKEYWEQLKNKLFEEFLEDFKNGYWYEVDTEDLAERVLKQFKKGDRLCHPNSDQEPDRANTI